MVLLADVALLVVDLTDLLSLIEVSINDPASLPTIENFYIEKNDSYSLEVAIHSLLVK